MPDTPDTGVRQRDRRVVAAVITALGSVVAAAVTVVSVHAFGGGADRTAPAAPSPPRSPAASLGECVSVDGTSVNVKGDGFQPEKDVELRWMLFDDGGEEIGNQVYGRGSVRVNDRHGFYAVESGPPDPLPGNTATVEVYALVRHRKVAEIRVPYDRGVHRLVRDSC